jgi:hypothetical protein
VDRRLARYRPVETDPVIDAEMRRIIVAGLEEQTELPVLPPAPQPAVEALPGAFPGGGSGEGPGRGRRVNARRHRG